MEEKIQIIKNNLTGDIEHDIIFLNSLYEEQNTIISDATATIEAINIVIEEIKDLQQPKEEKYAEETEIDEKINELLNHIDEESDEDALKSIEEIIPKIENLTKNEDGILYCSFKTEYEKQLFERIFADEKQVISTPYANDVIYIMYADLLLKKKKRTQAMEAIDRAIYWNFLSREAREKKLDIYFEKNEIVKYLSSLKLLHMISYTATDIAACYNKYAFVFDSLKDRRAAYAMYRLSYSYYPNDEMANIISEYEESDTSLKDMSADEIYNLALDNEVMVGANSKIIKALRGLITDLIENGRIKEAKLMLENDYSMTGDEAIADIYNKLLELEKNDEEVQDNEVTENVEEVNEETEVKEEKPKKKRATKSKKNDD
ncbi:MAG: hypothetical protein J6A15_06965 [Clostridia bacterium]|nr:hypothetical protein [Clostridia bacterium]